MATPEGKSRNEKKKCSFKAKCMLFNFFFLTFSILHAYKFKEPEPVGLSGRQLMHSGQKIGQLDILMGVQTDPDKGSLG